MQALILDSGRITSYIGLMFWPFVRVAAVFSIVPFLGSRLIPVRIKVVMAILITGLIVPNLPPVPQVDPLSAASVLIIINQIIIGLVMGFLLQLVFNAVVIAGENIAMTMGLGFAQMVDPQNGVQVPVVSQYYVIIGTLLFIAFNGHAALIQMMVNSFQILPISSQGFSNEALWQLLKWVSNMFIGALLVALPAVTALLIINIAMGVMTRAAPQLNIFSIGFPVTILVGFLLMLIMLPSFYPLFSKLLDSAFEHLDYLLRI